MSFSATNPYKLPFLPPKINLEYPGLIQALFDARVEIAELNGFAHAVPNPMLLLSPWVIREAVASSEIENINTTVIRALQTQLLPENRRLQPDKEVLHYRDALVWGFETMSELPLSGRLIRGIHQKLLPQSEGFRLTQNIIQNSLTGEIIYTPPSPQVIPDLISNVESFIHNEQTGFDALLKTAIAHYQFEAIHPFTDGNGRTGRILMVLQLVHEGVLKYPILYISGYIAKEKQNYYRLLRKVSEQNEWEDFILFLLKGFYRQAKITKKTLFSIMDFREDFRTDFKNQLPKLFNPELVDILFSQPIVTSTKIAELLNIHRSTASRHLSEMVEKNLLIQEIQGRNQYYINYRLLEML